MEMVNFQKIGSTSNAKIGSDFELTAKEFFRNEGITFKKYFKRSCNTIHGLWDSLGNRTSRVCLVDCLVCVEMT